MPQRFIPLNKNFFNKTLYKLQKTYYNYYNCFKHYSKDSRFIRWLKRAGQGESRHLGIFAKITFAVAYLKVVKKEDLKNKPLRQSS